MLTFIFVSCSNVTSFRLEHPNKLLHAIFEKLYDNDIVSEDGFQVPATDDETHTLLFE